VNLLSVGKNVYEGLGRSDDAEERIMAALRGASGIIEQSMRPVDLSSIPERVRPIWKNTSDLMTSSSTRVQKNRTALGTARYIRWGHIACDWNELVSKALVRAGGLDIALATTKAEELGTVAKACNEEMDKVLRPVASTTSGAENASMSMTKKVLIGGGLVAGILFVVRYFWGSKE
jgi:hypothetical protein